MAMNVNRPLTLPEQTTIYVPGVQGRATRRRRSRWEGAGLVAAGMASLALAAALLVAVAIAVAWLSSDAILPGVSAMGVPLGGMTTAEAEAWLASEWRVRELTVCAGGGQRPHAADRLPPAGAKPAGNACRRVAPESLGFTFDAHATALAAHSYGRNEADLDRLLAALRGADVPPVTRFDAALAEKGLQSLAPAYAKSPVNAGIRLDSGKLAVGAPVAGQALDVAATLATLRADPQAVLDGGRLDLRLKSVPPALNDARVFEAAAAQLRIAPINVRAYDPIVNKTFTWTVAPDVWYDWLSLDTSNGPVWRYDAAQATNWLTTQAATLDRWQSVDVKAGAAALETAVRQKQGDISLRVIHKERTHTVARGETVASIAQKYGMPYLYILRANPDDDGMLMPGDVLTIPSPDVFVPLPVVERKRIVVSIAAQKVSAYEDGALKWEWAASTGIASSPTTPGVYQVQSHQPSAYASIWNLDMPYFLGIYKPVPGSDFMNGFHGFPKRNGSQVLWTGNLGAPVTYGCVLVSTTNEQLLYDWAEDGVVVEIQA